MSNIYLSNGDTDIAFSKTQHGSEDFRLSLTEKDEEELVRMLKDPELKPGERRDVLNELAGRKGDKLAEVANDSEAGEAERKQATQDLARMIELGIHLKRGHITEAHLYELSNAIGLNSGDLHLPDKHNVVDN
jgi:hypothetical protein